MVQLDWKRLLSLSPEDLSEEEKDDLYASLIWYTPEPNIVIDHFRVLFRVTQDVLKYKGEQVESLVVELDDLAVRQGEEEARRHQNLIEEVEELRAQLVLAKRDSGHISREAGSEVEELRQELVKCELHNEELLTELKARERDILAEKREAEKYAGQVALLEREKAELQRELAALQSESSEHHGGAQRTESPEFSAEKQQEMADMIRQKNKHISQLLNDIETIEKENVILREKLSNLRDELSEATKSITEMTGELTGIKHTCQEQEEKMRAVEEENLALRSQVQELVEQKFRRDSQLDDFSEALDSRVEEWKRVLEEKNAEIEELQARLSHLAAQAPNIQIDTERSRVALLTQTLQKREDQIEALQQQLAQATAEMNESAELIEQLKTQTSKHRVPAGADPTTVAKLKSQLQQCEEKIQLLEGKLKDAEEDAQAKAQEASEMIIQLREYESGEYGLAEAVSEIKELRQQRRVRDKQIEELVQASNKLQAEAGQLEEQNLALREKLGMSTESPVRADGILAQRKKEQLLMKVLQQQAERLEEEKLQLKLENHKMNQRLGKLISQVQSLGQEPDVTTVDDVDTSFSKLSESVGAGAIVPSLAGKKSFSAEEVEELQMDRDLEQEQKIRQLEGKLRDMITENEALRKGMHEILDSIHNQDGTSAVEVESKTLERLLEALDSRHVSGWYHPAMRLQAQLHSLEGSNAVLREQLRSTRLEENKMSQQLLKAQMKIDHLELTLATQQEGRTDMRSMVSEEITLPPNLPLSSAEIIAKLNVHLLHVLDEYQKEEDRNKALEKKLEDFNKNYNIMRHQMGLLYKQHNTEKDEWKKAQEDFDVQKEVIKGNVEKLEAKVKEYDEHWTALSEDENEQKRLIAQHAQQMASAMADVTVLGRKCKFLQNLENSLHKENRKMKDDMASMECTVTQRIGELLRHKEMSAYRISALQSMLEDSVPLTTLEAANRQYSELTSKYRDLLQKEQNLVCEGQLAARLEGEVEALQKDKEELQTALQEAREKVHSLEVIVISLNQDTVTQDTHDNQISLLSKKLATIELRELNERQRADHADKMYQILKGQIRQLEERNAEVETQNSAIIQQNLELQQVERELRDNLLTYVSREELQQVKTNLHKAEKETMELKVEKDRLQEITDIAQEQVRNLELWKLSQEYQLDYMRRQILELQSTSDERAVIAKLNHELLSSRLSESSAHKTLQQLQNELSKLRSHNLRQEAKLDEKEEALNHLRSQLTSRCRSLNQAVQDLRRQYSGAVPLANLERLSLSLRRLGDERREAIEKLREAERKSYEAVTAREQAELQLSSLQELQVTLESSEPHKQLVEWHNRNTELRFKELKSRRHADQLQSQVQQLEERLCRQEEHIAALEQEQIHAERSWEQAQLSWEHTQNELYKQLAEYESEQKKVRDVQKQVRLVPETVQNDTDSSTTAVEQLKQAMSLVGSQSQSLLKYEAELAQLRAKVSSLTQEMEQKDKLLATKEKALTEMGTHLLSRQETMIRRSPVLEQSRDKPKTTEEKKQDDDITEKLALKATIDSLQNIVNQKEETIGRYQQLLKEGRDEHSQAASKFQEELRMLQTAHNNLQLSHNKLRSKLRHPSPSTKPVQVMVDQYVGQIQGLEDEVAELHTTVGNLSNQLHSYRQEANRWRTLAEDRLNNMGELRKRLEEQHSGEIEKYQEESQHYRIELESTKRDLTLVQEQLKQQSEAAQRGPSAVMQNCITMLRAQLKDKNSNEKLLSQTIADLQKEIKQLVDTPSRDGNQTPWMEGQANIRTLHTEVVNLRKQLKMSKDEATKLREQLSNRLKMTSKREASLERKAASQEDLQKKVKLLEEELQETKQKQDKEKSESEARKIKSAEEVARWDEKKRWQQTVEKQKQKLKEKTDEVERLQSTIKSLRGTITRLEREKNVLDTRIRASKSTAASDSKIEMLEMEKCKLQAEVTTLENKLEMQQHHSGGLGAAMLQERLEAQQRRIAVFELSKKGSSAVSEELEKLQETNATLQKANVRLESENLELRLDLEKYRSDTPRLREQVQHLETYVSLLKTESADSRGGRGDDGTELKPQKSIAELEKTVIAMKRVVGKLQLENKRLQSIKRDSVMHKKDSTDKIKAELTVVQHEKKELQEHYLEAMQRVTELEKQLENAQTELRVLQAHKAGDSRLRESNELELMKAQLIHKSQLLDKVKTLLQRAAAKEKILHDKVAALQKLLPDKSVVETQQPSRDTNL